MLYIIDANNLAGKLGLLGKDDFDKILLVRLKEYFQGKNRSVFLIFDSVDLMGDHYRDGSFEVVYTPRDGFYADADDKVLEVVSEFLANDAFKEEIFVVTDDSDLQEKLRLAIAYHAKKKRVKIERATDFARRVEDKELCAAAAALTDRSAAEDGADSLNAELLKIWGKQG